MAPQGQGTAHPDAVRDGAGAPPIAPHAGDVAVGRSKDATLGVLVVRFLLVGALAFGGGQAALPVLERLTVAETGWLSARDFATGIGLAYATPGPVLILAAFVGYHVAGVVGAVASTGAVFAVPVLTAVLMAQVVARLAGSARLGPRARAFGRYAGAAAIGLLVVTLVSVLRPLVYHAPALILVAAAIAVLEARRFPALVLLAGAAVLGAITAGVRGP